MRKFEMIIPRGIVVSCQLDANEPLNTPQHCALFAQAAAMGGAVAIRAEGIGNIQEIQATVRLPGIGCDRNRYDDGSVLVTPDMSTVDSLVRLGIKVLAVDATSRLRPGTIIDGTRFVAEIRRRHPYLHILADISTFEEGVKALDVGADAVSTVLFGRTPETFDQAGDIDAHLDLIYRLAVTVSQPVFAEGFIWSVEDATRAMESGAYGVIVGGAITRPRVLTQLFVDAVESRRV